MTEIMRAMAVTANGVKMIEVPKPTPGRDEVRVKVISTAVNAAEERVVAGDFVGRFLHAKTTPLVIGWDFAGTIDAVGVDVTDMPVGTSVWGHLAYSMSTKQGTFAEYITLPSTALATKPEAVPYHAAAAAATVAMTSLQSLRDEGRLVAGGKVLIIGAGGGVGSVAVGISKRLDGHVTAVCSTKDIERVMSFGADVVIDRKKDDPLNAKSVYDVVFDTPAVHSYGRCAKMLRAGGTYVTTLPDVNLVTGMISTLFTSKRCRFVQVASRRADLELVGGWLSDGLDATIDSRHRIADLAVALKRQADRGRVGRVVVDVLDNWSK